VSTVQLLTRAARRLWKQRVPPRVDVGIKTLLARDKPGRALDVFPDDTFIVSYPKSGNTWVRFLIANLVASEPADFLTMETRVPSIYNETSRDLAAMPRPRVLKSHEYFDPRYRRVLYVVRDPRDVVVSYYHYWVRKGFITGALSLDDFGDRFLSGRVDAFGTWHENVASWVAPRDGTEDFLVVRYEDLRGDCERELASIARLFNRTPTQADVRRIVEASSFERMRELERVADGATRHLKRKRTDVPFVRKGLAGGWRDELSPRLATRMTEVWAPMMRRFGYVE